MENFSALAIKQKANEIMKEFPWRFGQAVFNVCFDNFPNIANQLRGSNFDCFHNDNKVDAFLEEAQKLIKG